MKYFRKNTKKEKKQYYIKVIGAASLMSLLIIVLLFGISYATGNSDGLIINTASYDYSNIDVPCPDIEERLLTKNENSRPGMTLKEVKGIVVHYTANPGTGAEANRNYFESRKDCPDETKYKVSSHYIIDTDGSIIRCIPENEIAYASNKRNSDTISIECCHPDKSGKFTQQTYQSLVKLTAYLCTKYQLATENVIRHHDVTGKMCPLYYVKKPKAWKGFKKDVDSYLEKCKIRQ